MKSELDSVARDRESFVQGLMALYNEALHLRLLNVAEHLLCALEALARASPTCAAGLDRAYLSIDMSRALEASE